MSSDKATDRQPPVYAKILSIRSLVLLLITCCSLIFASILLWSGTGIINILIRQFGDEILSEKLNSIVQHVDYRYSTLARIGMEDSQPHRNEIRREELDRISTLRYKNTGSVFVVSRTGDIVISADFADKNDARFRDFAAGLAAENRFFTFDSGRGARVGAARYYEPWDSYIGIAIDQEELFAYKTVFIKIVLMLLAAVLLGTVLLAILLQRLLITPLIRISHFANQVSKNNFDAPLAGQYILELATLKTDVSGMVATLRANIDRTKAQLQQIRDRERWLDEALAALQESEKKYRTIYNAPKDAIIIYDPDKSRIVDANKGMYAMFGFQHDHITDLSMGDLSAGEPPYTALEAEKMVKKTLDGGARLFQWLGRKKNGETFWVEISLQPTYLEGKKQVLAVIRDIHHRKMAEQDLASEKERLAVTLRSIGDGVITTDRNGRIVLMNKIAEELTGWKQHEASGRRFPEVFRIISQQTGEPCPNPVDMVLATGLIVDLDANTVLVARDGSEKIIDDSGAPIRAQDSSIIGSVIVFRDVTEEKRMEEELFKIKKLESVGVLAGGIAHDFNNLLTGILGNVSMARKCLDDPERAEHILLNSEKAALRAKDLTAQLLTFSRGGKPVIKSASINATIVESAEFALRGSNVKAKFDIPDDLWLVNADTGQISQVIQNIVINARQAIAGEGTVEITCLNCNNCEHPASGIRDKCVRIIIEDNGPGIPPEIIDKVFDPYFTSKDAGSGLGLTICHSIISKHHGAISVESKPGRGTAFTILLPVSPDQNLDYEQNLPEPPSSRRRAKILVMDDDLMILELTRQMLEYLGHEAAVCEDGESAIREYKKAMDEHAPFDLVIMDLTIPGGMGGEKAVQELLKLDQEARAIVSSGYSNDRIISDYGVYGFKAVIVKPFQIEDLDKAIQDTLQL